jgi:hypothetical protein
MPASLGNDVIGLDPNRASQLADTEIARRVTS